MIPCHPACPSCAFTGLSCQSTRRCPGKAEAATAKLVARPTRPFPWGSYVLLTIALALLAYGTVEALQRGEHQYQIERV